MSSFGAPPTCQETGGSPQQGAGDDHNPAPSDNIAILFVALVAPVPEQVRARVVLRGRRGRWGNSALLVGAHPPRVGGWALCSTALSFDFGRDGQRQTWRRRRQQHW